MIVNIDELRNLLRTIDDINATPLEEIKWVENGRPVQITKRMIKDWKDVGLTNTWFIQSNYYQDGER